MLIHIGSYFTRQRVFYAFFFSIYQIFLSHKENTQTHVRNSINECGNLYYKLDFVINTNTLLVHCLCVRIHCTYNMDAKVYSISGNGSSGSISSFYLIYSQHHNCHRDTIHTSYVRQFTNEIFLII